jgi:hypothetical protein
MSATLTVCGLGNMYIRYKKRKNIYCNFLLDITLHIVKSKHTVEIYSIK